MSKIDTNQPPEGEEPARLEHLKRPTWQLEDVLRHFGEKIALQWHDATHDRRMAMEKQLLGAYIGQTSDVPKSSAEHIHALEDLYTLQEEKRNELDAKREELIAEIALLEVKARLPRKSLLDNTRSLLAQRLVEETILWVLLNDSLVTFRAVTDALRSQEQTVMCPLEDAAKVYRYQIAHLQKHAYIQPLPYTNQ